MRSIPVLSSSGGSRASEPGPHGLAFLRLGFRPFYLGGAVFAMLAVPLWVSMLSGSVVLDLPISAQLWHAHEMLFGFACTIIVGFLLTAGKVWTGLATPRGAFLGALAAIWLAARVAALTASYPTYVFLDIAFLPLVAAIFFDLIVRANNRRNLVLVALLLLLSLANLVFHLATIGVLSIAPVRALYAGLALVTLIECVMAGRVVPSFTLNATPGMRQRSLPGVEVSSLPLTAVALAMWVLEAPAVLAGSALALAGILHALRLWSWQPWVTRSRPILWVLHAAYAWIPVGLVLLAASSFGLLGISMGVHALAVGATSGLIIGMITRTARGHTGRETKASKLDTAAYLLVMFAAVTRVMYSITPGTWSLALLWAAAAAWCTAFGIYVCVYGPWLLRGRLDGKDG